MRLRFRIASVRRNEEVYKTLTKLEEPKAIFKIQKTNNESIKILKYKNILSFLYGKNRLEI